MNLYIVGGFLGSGKTTAIVEAARYLMARKKVVGIVTNDQGKYLVDTAFVRAEGIPAVEVTGGCFCCQYDDFGRKLLELREKLAPDSVFAESVGSCADIIATVLNPLIKYKSKEIAHSVLSVFTDVRFFQAKMKGEDLPFSEEVNYIYDEQIKEAGILVLNKKDTLNDREGETLLGEAKKKYPGKIVLLQNSLDIRDIEKWIGTLSQPPPGSPFHALDLDYDKYSRGEAQLAWLDAKISFRAGEPLAWERLVNSFLDILCRKVQQQARMAHLKCEIVCGEQYRKISVTSFQKNWESQNFEALRGREISLLVNLRAETLPGILQTQLKETLSSIPVAPQVEGRVEFENAFAPAKPDPTYRIP